MKALTLFALGSISLLSADATMAAAPAKVVLLNASYDVSRELFAQINPAFQEAFRRKTGQAIEIRQSHGGSSKQARSVAEGLQADVVTFNQVTDIDFLARSGLVGKDWRQRFPDHASPYYSLPIFLVRAGNPKGIADWDDLGKPGVQPIFPNPKTSGNGRYSYLGAYAYALGANANNDAKARALVGAILHNVPVFDSGGRGSTTTFIERQIGDVLVTFESEVGSILKEYPKSGLQAVYPSVSVRADFPVAVVDKVVARHATTEAARAYLRFLYSAEGQNILAKNFNRVSNQAIAASYKAQFPAVRLVSVEDTFGGWERVMSVHFAEGGVLDQLVEAK